MRSIISSLGVCAGSICRHGCIRCKSRYERGTALIISMVILLILTILGVTAIGTSTLEEKMSGNVQEVTRAFQAAESGLNQALRSGTALDPNQTTQNTYTFDGGKSGTATVTTSFRQYGNLPRSQTPSGTGFTGAHFNMASEGKVTATGAKTVVNQGVAQTMRSLD